MRLSLISPCAAECSPLPPRSARLVARRQEEGEATELRLSVLSLTEPLHHGKTAARYFYSAYSICPPEHGGTHIDAPIHFAEGGLSVDRIPPERLVGPAVVLDVSAKAAKDSDYRVTAEDIEGEERARGAIPRGGIVLLRTGWAKRRPDRKSCFGDDKPGDASNLHSPASPRRARSSWSRAASRVSVWSRRASITARRRTSCAHQILMGRNLRHREPRQPGPAAAARRDDVRAADEDRRRFGRARAVFAVLP
jgi:putative cyclase